MHRLVSIDKIGELSFPIGQPSERHFSHQMMNFVLHSEHPLEEKGCHGKGIGKAKNNKTIPPTNIAKISTIKINLQFTLP